MVACSCNFDASWCQFYCLFETFVIGDIQNQFGIGVGLVSDQHQPNTIAESTLRYRIGLSHDLAPDQRQAITWIFSDINSGIHE